jgi:hypothetical protein
MAMRRSQRIVLLATLIAIAPAIIGCADFDADKLDIFKLNEKKKLPGERQPVFPEGVPGVTQGIPPEYIRGNQQQQTGAAVPVPSLDSAAAAEPPKQATAAEPPKAEAKPKPKPKRTVKRKPKPQPKPAATTAQQPAAATPATQQTQPADSPAPWPAPAQSSNTAPWPSAPPPGTFTR